MARDNYPANFNETLLEDPMTELREQVEADADITYELRVIVDGELVAHKKTRIADEIITGVPAAENLVSQKNDELTELRAEQEADND